MEQKIDDADDYDAGESTPLLSLPTTCTPKNNVGGDPDDTKAVSSSLLMDGIWFAWSKSLPFCVLNGAIALCWVFYCFGRQNPGMHHQEEFCLRGTTSIGHQFANYAVAFMVVSKVVVSLKRSNDLNDRFSTMCGTTRDLVKTLVILTMEESGAAHLEWRSEVTYRALLLLRTTVAVLNFRDTGIPSWDIAELDGVELEKIRQYANLDDDNIESVTNRSKQKQSLRVPHYIGFMLRQSIIRGGASLPSSPLAVEKEARLLEMVDFLDSNYHSIEELLTTPTPFLLTETTRTFLFLYIFTMPLALSSVLVVDGDSLSNLVSYFLAVLFVTYGFVGLEMVSAVCDNSFGSNNRTFVKYNCITMAQQAFEDVYLFTLDLDGRNCAHSLFYTMDDCVSKPLSREPSWIFQSAKIDFRPGDIIDDKTVPFVGAQHSHPVTIMEYPVP